MSSYYDDPDFAEEYRWRDEMALDAALSELDDEDRDREARRQKEAEESP